MIYAQIASGQKLHLACEAGEEYRGEVIRKGHLSAPLCRPRHWNGSYRMSCNVSLAEACQNCWRIYNSWRPRP